MEAKQYNYVKSSACIIKRGSSCDNILSDVENLESTDSILQSIIPLYSDTLKEVFMHMGVNIINFPVLKKQTVALEIEKRWCQDIIKEGAIIIAYLRSGPSMEQG